VSDPYAGELDVPGVIYLLCFSEPFRHARHYLGWAGRGRLEQRLEHHERGTGANLLRHVRAAGITWTLVRTWEGTRHRERALKLQGGHSRKCPACTPGIARRLARVPGLDHSLAEHEHPDLHLAGLPEPLPLGAGPLHARLETVVAVDGKGVSLPVPC
jgi:hypothetical protein